VLNDFNIGDMGRKGMLKFMTYSIVRQFILSASLVFLGDYPIFQLIINMVTILFSTISIALLKPYQEVSHAPLGRVKCCRAVRKIARKFVIDTNKGLLVVEIISMIA